MLFLHVFFRVRIFYITCILKIIKFETNKILTLRLKYILKSYLHVCWSIKVYIKLISESLTSGYNKK